ncbi:VC0807 family protein [Fodinicola acaciae]|uniref:VC0807 family protein n=1 Tax=Fodinicola acaciae TaxID=2681555 RepID=UPI0013D67678|nr:VC0807 family protein [Fodinicola acaciae]
MTAVQSKPRGINRAIIVNLAIDVAAPVALFYLLRAFGVNQWLALTLAAIPPAARAVQSIITSRKIDGLALFALSIIALSLLGSFVTGSPRFLLAKDGWMTAVAGGWILLTILRTPFIFSFLRTILTGEALERMEGNWRDSPTFRHSMRVATAIWGVGLVFDAGVRVVLAYTLPIDQVPLISTLQYVVLFVCLEVGTRLYLRRKSIRDKIESESSK